VPPGARYWNPAFGAWAGAALYDAAKFVEATDPVLASQARACSLRLGRWAAESLEGDVLPWVVIFEPALAAGIGGQPVPSLTPYFANGLAKKVSAGIDSGAWAYRGIACAADLGDPVAAAAEARLLDRWDTATAYWSFLVRPDWSYAVPEARALVGE
jgi:hypothetical protein